MSRKSLQKVRLVKKEYRPGIEASMRVRSARSLAHLETMRDAYVAIVRARLADPTIKESKKLSFYAIAKRLTAMDFHAPNDGDITYKIARRLSQIVGEVAPLPKVEPVTKLVSDLQVGDCVEVIAKTRSSGGLAGIIRMVLNGGAGFQVEVNLIFKRKLILFLAEEIRHQPDERHFYDPLSLAKR